MFQGLYIWEKQIQAKPNHSVLQVPSFFLYYPFMGTQLSHSASLLKSCGLFLCHSQARKMSLPN